MFDTNILFSEFNILFPNFVTVPGHVLKQLGLRVFKFFFLHYFRSCKVGCFLLTYLVIVFVCFLLASHHLVQLAVHMVSIVMALLVQVVQVLLYLRLFERHLQQFRYVNFNPQSIILRNFKFYAISYLLILLIFLGKILSQLLSQKLFIIDKNILWWLFNIV